MQKILALLLLFLFVKTTAFSQNTVVVMGVLPVQKSSQLPPHVASMLEDLIWEKVMAQRRFKIEKTSAGEPGLILGSAGATDLGRKVGATHLAEITIKPFSFMESKIPEKFDQDFKVEMTAIAEVELKVMDIATGEIIELSSVKGQGNIMQNIAKINPERTRIGKDKKLVTTKKTEKEMQQEHKQILQNIATWRQNAHQTAVRKAAEQFNEKFERLLMPEITVLEIVEEKKGKAYKVALSLVEGLDYNKKEYFKVKQTSYLEFNNEIVGREVKIGGVKFLAFENGKAVFKVLSGKEEIYAAMQKAEKLVCVSE